ncbi:hypothetical protein M422DRAFT_773567 [Sphaerobolus stellatus SS14]|nr:hypothetical protein M422DRAFT_773567 [Sphaerobolus stellatus SS14]
MPWSSISVIVALSLCVVTFILFVLIALFWAREPVLAPFLLKQKVPVLIGLSQRTSVCNFTIMYFFPIFFETVMLTSSTAGAHLLPNSVAMSIPLGFGHAVVLQTTSIALLVHVNQFRMTAATGFSHLWHKVGIAGVAFPSAIFQAVLDRELPKRITGPGTEETIRRIRHSPRLVISLPPNLQSATRASYGIAPVKYSHSPQWQQSLHS